MPGKKRLHFKDDEERKEFYRNRWRNISKPKEEADERRLGYLREDGTKKIREGEIEEFLPYIREKNRKRLEELMSDAEAWERINESNVEWDIKKARQERRKRLGEFVNDKDVQRANDIIYGGKIGNIIEEERVEEPYDNPYE